MKELYVIALLAISSSAMAQDEYSTDSSGNYAMDLGQVYGAIRSVKSMGEICTESFPDQEQTNTAAYKQWRAAYLPFIQEMEHHFSTMVWKESGGTPKKHVQLLIEADKSFEQYRAVLKSQMSADGNEAFHNLCNAYPVYLASKRMDLEHYYAEQVAVVRKGPVNQP